MKTLTLIISVLMILAFFGCMENQLTQPETSFNYPFDKTSPGAVVSSLPILKDELKLCCELLDPLTGNCELHGSVVYIHTTLSNNGGYARIQIRLNMNSELCTRMMNCAPYTINGCSCDTIYVQDMGISFIEKNYEIKNRPDIRLGVKYRVTTDGAEIFGTTLHQIDQ
jgi:hypothetical protein